MMRSHLCTACWFRRTQAASTAASKSRSLTGSSRKPQDVSFADPLPRAATSTRYSQPRSYLRHDSNGGRDRQDKPDLQQLRPRDLLEELNKPVTSSPLQRPRRQEVLPMPLGEKDDYEYWKAISHLISQPASRGDLRNSGYMSEKARKEIWLRTLRLSKRWLDTLGGAGSLTSGDRSRQNGNLGHSNARPPGPAVLFNFYATVTQGLAHVNLQRLLWILSSGLLELSTRQKSSSQIDISDGLRELMAMWNQFMQIALQPKHSSRGSDSTTEQGSISFLLESEIRLSAADWSFLPSNEHLRRIHSRPKRRSFENELHRVVRYSVKQQSEKGKETPQVFECASSALVCLHLLEKTPAENKNFMSDEEQFRPWVKMMKLLLGQANSSDIPATLLDKSRLAEDTDVRQAYLNIVDKLKQTVSGTQSSEEPSNTSEAISKTSNDLEEISVLQPALSQDSMDHESVPLLDTRFQNYQRRISHALKAQDLSSAQHTLTKLKEYQSSHPDTVVPLQLYESFLLTFLSLRKPQTAIDIWNELIRAGHKPTSKTYTVMMRGAQHVRDINGMQSFWLKMRQAGIQPDSHAWSVLIFGLFRSGRDESGLKAVAELTSEWKNAAYKAFQRDNGKPDSRTRTPEASIADLVAKYPGDVDGATRPDVVIMNSAISALSSRNDTLIPKMLSWGRSFGIEPDSSTYNVLLNLSMRRSLPDEALAILQRMKERGIAANSTTWTVLLTAMFEGGFIDNLDPKDQEKQVMNLLHSISPLSGENNSKEHKHGVDQKGYALLIDRLLKRYNNPSAAESVLRHMISQGVYPQTHIYTILMTAYFASSPPDFYAVQQLWDQLHPEQPNQGQYLDSVFYDRMIEGYARHHKRLGTSDPLVRVLALMEQKAKQPSWYALEQAARCLAERGEHDRLSQLVMSAKQRLQDTGQPLGGLGSEKLRFGQRDFWRFVASTGLLVGDGINNPDQISQRPIGPLQRRGMQGAMDDQRS